MGPRPATVGRVTITEFLAARLNETEAAAKAAASDPVGAMEAHFEAEALQEEQDWRLYPDRKTEYSRGQADALHWAAARVRERMRPLSLHDPARVLREAEAKRKILAEHRLDDMVPGVCYRCRYGVPAHWESTPYPCPTLRALAAVYAAHPDYDPDWT
jgi:Family of unknown function (DUF6221)